MVTTKHPVKQPTSTSLLPSRLLTYLESWLGSQRKLCWLLQRMIWLCKPTITISRTVWMIWLKPSDFISVIISISFPYWWSLGLVLLAHQRESQGASQCQSPQLISHVAEPTPKPPGRLHWGVHHALAFQGVPMAPVFSLTWVNYNRGKATSP